MKRIVFLLLATSCLMASAWAQVPAANPPQPVSVPVQAQSQIDSAWKDIQIAQLRLQLVIEQTLSGMRDTHRKDPARRQGQLFLSEMSGGGAG